MKQLHNGLGEPRPTLFLLLLLIETCLFIQTNVANPPISCFSFDPFFSESRQGAEEEGAAAESSGGL